MAQRDIYHEACKNALTKDGWIITHDPLILSFGKRNVYVDLGAELPLAAEKGGRKIAVEVKSFRGPSEIVNLENALGKYVFYRSLLAQDEPERVLYLAVTDDVFRGIFTEPLGQFIQTEHNLRIIVFDDASEVISKWIQ
jgi:hypothetical protein